MKELKWAAQLTAGVGFGSLIIVAVNNVVGNDVTPWKLCVGATVTLVALIAYIALDYAERGMNKTDASAVEKDAKTE